MVSGPKKCLFDTSMHRSTHTHVKCIMSLKLKSKYMMWITENMRQGKRQRSVQITENKTLVMERLVNKGSEAEVICSDLTTAARLR